jgi:hypothetical protein
MCGKFSNLKDNLAIVASTELGDDITAAALAASQTMFAAARTRMKIVPVQIARCP